MSDPNDDVEGGVDVDSGDLDLGGGYSSWFKVADELLNSIPSVNGDDDKDKDD